MPWLIPLTRDLGSAFALAGYPVHLADSQSIRVSLGVWQAQWRAGVYAEASAMVYTSGQGRGVTAIATIAGGLVLLRM